ncbi:Hypothetical predicted protein [Olea europaea subsp. europaea]|uniref:Uncharacterized protein n=1 Tax=Olea europaea subsp. europaea TaxID=158383 RepID=A0A8S0S5K8_OLEEU|nr:Hypothetical predicted protein [Olea europaea subsp. europaea]
MDAHVPYNPQVAQAHQEASIHVPITANNIYSQFLSQRTRDRQSHFPATVVGPMIADHHHRTLLIMAHPLSIWVFPNLVLK